jgi:hypothetical protein
MTARWASVPCRCSQNRWARPFPTTVAQECPAAETALLQLAVHRNTAPPIFVHRFSDCRLIRLLIRNLTT